MTDTIRVLRTLEYIGDRKLIEDNLSKRSVKGTRSIPSGYIINEAIIGEFAEIVPSIKDKKEMAHEFIKKNILDDVNYIEGERIWLTEDTLLSAFNDLIDHLGY